MIADLYIRVSTEEQKEYGYSQRYQEEVLKAYCTINILEIGHVVFEDCSAKTFIRPGWHSLFSAYKSKRLSTPRFLLFTKWDRFSRNTGDAYYMINQLSLLGVKVRAIEQPLDLSIPETKIMMAYFLAVPEVENERRGMNIRQGIQRARKEGRVTGKPPVGYIGKTDSNGWKFIVPLEPYAELMKLAFEELAKGVHNTSQVYQFLVSLGFDKSCNCFRKAVRNPLYCGKVSVQSSEPGTAVEVQGQHEALVTETLFDTVQKVLKRRIVNHRKVVSHTSLPLRGVLICPICQKILTGSGSKGRYRVYFYYHCQSKCGQRFGAIAVHGEFDDFLESLIPSAFFAQHYRMIFDHFMNRVIGSDADRQLKVQFKINELRGKIDRAKILLIDQGLDVKDYQTFREKCLQEILMLEEVSLNIVREINDKTSTLLGKKELFFHLDHLWRLLEVKKKKEFAFLLFPYGVKYEAAAFCILNIATVLQFVYGDATLVAALIRSASFYPDERAGMDQVEQPAFIKGIIENILNEYRYLSLKQAVEIVRFLIDTTKLCINMRMDSYEEELC